MPRRGPRARGRDHPGVPHLTPPDDTPRLPGALELPLEPQGGAGPGPVLELPRHRLDLGSRFAVMGIVNRTPDSFYDRGATFGLEDAVAHALRLEAEGADILDIGGVKGGPGPPVSPAEEIDRVVPLIDALRRDAPEAILSVDTFRAEVAQAAVDAGADIINDVTGLSDPDLVEVVRHGGVGYVAMHHGGEPRTRPLRPMYDPDVTTAVVSHCAELTRQFVAAGVPAGRLIVDPGHDFQKTTRHSLEVTRRLPELAALGFPVLVALSNKDFVGETLDVPLDGRVDGSLAAAVFAVLRGANIVRVHEVARTVQVLRMTETLLGWRPPAATVRGLE